MAYMLYWGLNLPRVAVGRAGRKGYVGFTRILQTSSQTED